MDFLRAEKDGFLTLVAYIQPGAAREGITGLHGGAVKLCITAPPVEGKANLAAIRFLARLFSLPKSAVLLHSGSRNRLKSFHLRGLCMDDARAVLKEHLQGPAADSQGRFAGRSGSP